MKAVEDVLETGEVPSGSIVGPVVAVLAVALVGAAGWFWVGGKSTGEQMCNLTLGDGRYYVWPRLCYAVDAKKEHRQP